MMNINNGVLTVRLDDKEVTANGLTPIILKRYELVLAEKAVMLYEIERLKTAKPYVFSFSAN